MLPDTFVKNPQYTVEITDPDGGKYKSENKCTLLVSLMQKPRGFPEKVTNLTIGFIVFRVRNVGKYIIINWKYYCSSCLSGFAWNCNCQLFCIVIWLL